MNIIRNIHLKIKNTFVYNKEYSQGGFTLAEVILSIFLATIILASMAALSFEINKSEIYAKESKFALELIDPYIGYYQGLEVKQDDLSTYLSDNYRVDLIKRAEESGAIIPIHYSRRTTVMCINDPYMDDDSKYIVFSISCELNGNPINKNRPFEIKKWIQ